MGQFFRGSFDPKSSASTYNIVTTLAQEVGLEIFVIVTSTIVLSRTLLLLFHAQRTSGPRAGRTMQPVDEFLTVKFSFFEVALPP